MANLLLTNRCVRSCPYCFARRELKGAQREEFVSWEDLVFVADFLANSGEHHISLLGGEPTIHPDFVDMVLYLAEREFEITVFTSGMLSAARLRDVARHLRALEPGPFNFVCNLNDPVQTPAPQREQQRVHAFLDEMGPWVTPGFNIYRTDFELQFLVDLIGQYGLQRHLRLGVAHPVPGAAGSHIRPQWGQQVAQQLWSHRQVLDRMRIKPGFDCGFLICHFTDEQLGWLHRLTGGGAKFECGAPIDIAPDMSVYRCFPLSKFHRKSLYEFDSLREIDEFYDDLNGCIQAELPGIFEQCDGCVHRQEETCSGGGACHLLNRLAGEAPVRLPDIEEGLAQIGVCRQPPAD